MVELFGIPSDQVHKFWPIIERWILEKCDRLPDICNGELYEDCLNTRKQLWLAYDGTLPIACMITGINEGEVHIYLATGERLTDWAHLFHEFKSLCKAHGFKTITSLSRKGWVKALATTGAKQKRVELVWDL